MKIVNMTKPMIIAICGAKRSGKDVLADHLVHHYNYEKIKIAEPLKLIVNQLFSFTPEQTGEGDEKDELDARWGITPRQALQFFGTEVMQFKIQELLPHIGRKFWISALTAKLSPHQKYVISDLRFYHEYEELAKHKAYIIKVSRPSNSMCDPHCSEEEYKKIPHDLLITNDSDIPNLLIKLDNALAGK